MPKFQTFMNDPVLMRSLIMSNLQMWEIIDRHPDFVHILNDLGTLRQPLDVARSPERHARDDGKYDRTMRSIESSPEGFNLLSHIYEIVRESFLNATTIGGDSGK